MEPITIDTDRCRPSNILRHRRSDNSNEDTFDEPPWVSKTSEGYRVLWHGGADFEENGTERTALLIRDDEQPDWKLSLRLWNRFGSLSPLEKGRVLAGLRERGLDRDQLLATMDGCLELPRSEDWLNCYMQFPQLPEPVQDLLHNEELDPRHIRFLNQMPEGMSKAVLDAFSEGGMRLSVQETRQLMEALRRLDEDQIKQVRSDLKDGLKSEQDVPPRKRGRRLLETTRRRAFPRTTQRREHFQDKLDELDLPGQIRVSPPQNFEGDYVDVRIRCHRDDSIDRLAEALKSCRPLLEFV